MTPRWAWLPAPNTWKYHALLLGLGIFVLGPLGGVAASFMNFSLGFFIGGQVLAGILGSTVTYGYGEEGKHGANYIQTAAASVASLSAMGVLIQAMVWMGLPQPPAWQMVLYFLCIGMFAAGIGMLYTPILVDQMQLTFPSGLAVANILRALTDPVLLKRSVGKLGTGISLGLTDQNPISSAFVVSVLIMATLGLKDPIVGLMAGAIVLIATSTASDMQQDRSTGWRLGTNRVIQFRYQAAGILMGAIMGVAFARLFMAAYPVLLQDQTVMSAAEQPANWSAAMTFKIVGVLRSLTEPKPFQITAIWVGVALGFAIELARKAIHANASYQRFVKSGRAGFATDFVVDAVVLPSPYAVSFGGFVNLSTSLWFGAGGIVSSAFNAITRRVPKDSEALPDDMSTTSLFGGGLIAGDALAALGIGIVGLVSTVLFAR